MADRPVPAQTSVPPPAPSPYVDQGPPLPRRLEQRELMRMRGEQGPPLPRRLEQRERQRVNPDDQGPRMPRDVAQREQARAREDAETAKAYRLYRNLGTAADALVDPAVARRAKLLVLQDDGQLTPDLVRQLPPEDQEWLASQYLPPTDELGRRRPAGEGASETTRARVETMPPGYDTKDDYLDRIYRSKVRVSEPEAGPPAPPAIEERERMAAEEPLPADVVPYAVI